MHKRYTTTLTRPQKHCSEMKSAAGLTRLTRWLISHHVIASQWGPVSNLEWCRLEAQRINASPEHKAEVGVAKDTCAVFAWTSLPILRSQDRPAV